MATYNEAYKKSLEYFGGDELAAQVFLGKYALTTSDGDIVEKTPDEMHHRLAGEFARIEMKYKNPLPEEQIYNYLKNFKYIIPQGSPMAGIGNPYQVMSLSNCFVIESPYDSYGGILKTDQEEAQLMKRRGGVGFDISTIRPKGLLTSNAAKTTTGIGVFMNRFSNTCREVGQDGRRGALMLTISVHHPEIRTFVNIKRDLKKVTGANISIRLSDEFMQAVKDGKNFELRWPVDSADPKLTTSIDARGLWHEIIESAHAAAEPGLLFWDTVKRFSPADAYESLGFGTVSTNPCGEITLSPYDSCRLLLVNAVSFVRNPFTKRANIDWEKFAEVVQAAQKLMDDVVDLELECVEKILQKIEADPEPEDVKSIERNMWHKIRHMATQGRRTGLGVTAIGDAIAAMNVKYGSAESIELIEEIYKNLAVNSYRSSVEMARDRGAFPAYDYECEKNHTFINRIMDVDPELKKNWQIYGRRNIANTTTAPAGSVSIETQTTSGIESVFKLSYTRRRKINPNDKQARVDYVDQMGDKWQEYTVFHHWFEKWMDITGKTDPEESPYWGATSSDIDWTNKVKAQAAAQKWICHSISNTTNVPEDTSIEVIKDIYMTGWESGCKGVTVYRDNCRSGVLVTNGRKKKFDENHAPKRPEKLPCDIYHMQVRGERWNFFIGLFDDKPYEIFAGRSKFIHLPRSRKKGYTMKNGTYNLYTGEGDNQLVIENLATVFDNPTESAFTRTVSLALRHGVPVQFVVEQITKGADSENEMFSLAKGLVRVLKEYIKDGTKPTLKKCPQCGSKDLAYQEGCITCKGCGHSKCG
jgi:ribonucleoside-diphosphate reductase alpha chain